MYSHCLRQQQNQNTFKRFGVSLFFFFSHQNYSFKLISMQDISCQNLSLVINESIVTFIFSFLCESFAGKEETNLV